MTEGVNKNKEYLCTVVSGYWIIKSKRSHNEYLERFKNTLKINCPYVFFGNKESIEIVKKYRNELPTYYIECNICEFYTYKYKEKFKTHSTHCPSIELNLIWNEKIFFIEKASKLNLYKSTYFIWIDAGINVFAKGGTPITEFPNIKKLTNLPVDKFIYTSSKKVWQQELALENSTYQYISGTYLLHINFIEKFSNIYKEYLEKLIDKNNIWTDQVILTHIYKDNPDLFYKLCNGYGRIITELY
jgi:hypothetical protein